MSSRPLILTCPCLGIGGASDMEVFGSATWLFMNAPEQRDMPIVHLDNILMPPLKLGQFLLASEKQDDGNIKPIAFAAWGNLGPEAESRYLKNADTGLKHDDWNSGDRMWVTDWLTPFGHSAMFQKCIRTQLRFSTWRALYHRGHERGAKRILEFRGVGVTKEHANTWWADRQPRRLPPPLPSRATI